MHTEMFLLPGITTAKKMNFKITLSTWCCLQTAAAQINYFTEFVNEARNFVVSSPSFLCSATDTFHFL